MFQSIRIENYSTDELKYFTRLGQSLEQYFGSINQVKSVLSGWLLQMLENRVVLNISHLLCKLTDGELAVSVQVVQSRRLLPEGMVLLLE